MPAIDQRNDFRHSGDALLNRRGGTCGPVGFCPVELDHGRTGGPTGFHAPFALETKLADSSKKGGVAAKPANQKKVKGRSLTFVGSFKNPWQGKPAEEGAAALADKWEPSVDDWSVLAKAATGSDPMQTDSIFKLLGAIVLQPEGSVSEVNIFTHANRGYIAFAGKIIPSQTITDVQLFQNDAAGNKGVMDEDLLNDLPNIPYFEVTSGNKTRRFTLKDVQKRFTEDARINVFACHSGQAGPFLQLIADTFQVKVTGFEQVVRFDVVVENNAINRSKETVGLGYRSNGGTVKSGFASSVRDFHELLDKGVTKSPTK